MEYTVANVKEENRWEEGVYQIEVTDPVVGGADGISNKQAIQLANRTGYLKGEIEALKSDASAKLANKRDISDSYSMTETAALIATKLDSAIAEATYFKKTDKIDAYTKKESDKKFALKDDLPPLATEAKEGIVKLKNSITAKQEDVAVTEKAVSDLVETKMNSTITDNYVKLPGGFIVQWGKREAPNNQGKTIFPIAFPHKCLHVMISQYGSDYAQPTNEQYIASTDNAGFTRAKNTWSFYWVAFGY